MSLQGSQGGPWAFLSRGTDGRDQHKSSAAQKVSEGRSLKETSPGLHSQLAQTICLVHHSWRQSFSRGRLQALQTSWAVPRDQIAEMQPQKGCRERSTICYAECAPRPAEACPPCEEEAGGAHCTSPRQPALAEETGITGAAVVLNYQHRGILTRTIRTFKGTWWECHQLPERTTKTE